MKWISVKDKLPKEKVAIVLVNHYTTKGNKMLPIVDTAFWRQGKFYHSMQVHTLMGAIVMELKDISHWMPLPEPPAK